MKTPNTNMVPHPITLNLLKNYSTHNAFTLCGKPVMETPKTPWSTTCAIPTHKYPSIIHILRLELGFCVSFKPKFDDNFVDYPWLQPNLQLCQFSCTKPGSEYLLPTPVHPPPTPTPSSHTQPTQTFTYTQLGTWVPCLKPWTLL